MLENFCLRLAGGLTFSLLLLPPRVVSSRFFRSQLLITLCLIVTAGALTWNSGANETLFWAALGAATGLAIVAFWLWSAEGIGMGVVASVLLAVALVAAN